VTSVSFPGSLRRKPCAKSRRDCAWVIRVRYSYRTIRKQNVYKRDLFNRAYI
jgi:hypothetical protein